MLKKMDTIQSIIYEFGFKISEVDTSNENCLSIDYRRSKIGFAFDDITNISLYENDIVVYSDDVVLLRKIAKDFNTYVEDGEVYI